MLAIYAAQRDFVVRQVYHIKAHGCSAAVGGKGDFLAGLIEGVLALH
ncbi:hypothetical protein H9L05_09770 [Hymenobacter qilianensis]|uniref:Uncharacterized protein n=1 Tax=Hymenobacter qilianensis TaxID=1385715 RepID=A0A7H0GZS4_9BACT|nr:hypothetical protein H9L05_09770 [Hymenobacter qilianensis]